MNTEDLLKPRYKVIAGYPESQFRVGDILQDWDGKDWFSVNPESFTIKSLWAGLFPHLFKKLEWWEERKPEEMPKCVRIDYKIYDVIAYSDYKGGTFYIRGKNEFSPCKSYPLKNSLPATKEDYDKFNSDKGVQECQFYSTINTIT